MKDPGPPPDGGLKAWTQACMGHLVVFNTWGVITSFGVFQAYYTSELGLAPSAVSWIGSVQTLGHFFVGAVSGRALDAGYFYHVFIGGLLIELFGVFMTSLCTQYWQLFLAQGVVTGIGCGMQFCPAVSLVTTYFQKNRILAVAVVVSGSATGGMIYPTIVRQLLPKIGFAWVLRVMGLIMVAIGCLTTALLRPRLPPQKSGPLIDFSAFRESTYSLYCVAMFLGIWGQFYVFYYVGSYGIDVIGVSYSTSVNMLLLMNGLGLFGRVIPAYFADRNFGPLNTIIPFPFIGAILIYCWAAVRTEAALYVFASLYGLLIAGFQGLFPGALSSLTKDMSKAGARMGMCFSFVGVASLTGPPLAGALIQAHGGSYLYAQMWSASALVVSGLVLIAARISSTGWVLVSRI
ncbi:MFS general substrate transporter [Lophium mytilinum]|uniref:MFS general substrate transporter n=1 Tax=Lophium mytilinum TaxID=390894 RepID=A0A6A6QID1_9PEZI|nr:MFS general substrate transporter [Lophium mytilinum]